MVKLKALVIAILMLGLAACSGGGAPSTKELVVGLTYIPDIQFAPWYIAEARGYFEDEGLNVRLQHHGSSESLFGGIESGDEHVVVAGADEMLQARAAGTQLQSFGVVYQNYPVVVIVPEDSAVQSFADLAGKRVGLPGPYGENWFALRALMADSGLTDSDLTVEYIGYTQQASLVAGDVDAVVGFVNNDAVTFGIAGIGVSTLPTPELPLVGISHGASDETVASRGAELAAFNRAVSRAIVDIKADPQSAVETVFETVDELAISGNKEAARAILDATVPLYGDGSLQLGAERWPAMYEFMVANGIAEPGIDPADAVAKVAD